jgi:3-dehydroquinate synthetase
VTPAGAAARIRRVLARHGLPADPPTHPALTLEALRAAMALDKKADAGATVRLVLLEDIGRATVRSVGPEALRRLLAEDFA